MAENPRIKIPFGDALDRESGLMVMRPGGMEDIRNMVLRDGSAVVRHGFGSALDFLVAGRPMTAIVAGVALKSARAGVVVAYEAVTGGAILGRVHVFMVDADGLKYEYVGEWDHDLGVGWEATPPVIHMAESYGKVFMAHDKLSVTERAPTIYYNPTSDGNLHILTNDFVSTDAESVVSVTRFRGVCRWLNYLVGWGYGSEYSDRPEFLRTSIPGEPEVFNREHYAIVGNRRDPIRTAIPCGDRFGVFKETEGYPFVGSGRDDFGISPVPIDPLFGVISGRLAVNYGGYVMAWSVEGPRIWDFKGPSRDIAMPLDLDGPEPSTLVAQGDTKYAFACYIPGDRIVAFFFGKRVYTFSVRDEANPKWAGYWELPNDSYCAFTLYSGEQLSTAPTGYPKIDVNADTFVDDYDAGGTYADVVITNYGQTGDESIEVWLNQSVESGEGLWYLLDDPFEVQPTPTQVIRVTGLTPGSDYTMAVRYKRGLLYTPSHTSDNPYKWPSQSRGTFITAIDPPTMISAVWSRVDASNEKMTLTIRPAAGQETQDIDVYLNNTTLLGTISGPHTGDVTFVHANMFDDVSYTDELDMEDLLRYSALTVGESATESIQSDELLIWPGPAGIPTFGWIQSLGGGYSASVNSWDGDASVEVWDNYDDAGSLGAWAFRFGIDIGDWDQGWSGSLPGPSGVEVIDVSSRYKETAFGVEDWGELGAGPYRRTVDIYPGSVEV